MLVFILLLSFPAHAPRANPMVGARCPRCQHARDEHVTHQKGDTFMHMLCKGWWTYSIRHESRAGGGVDVAVGRDHAQCESDRLAENLESQLVRDDALKDPFACGH